jgi:hypothetical protein
MEPPALPPGEAHEKPVKDVAKEIIDKDVRAEDRTWRPGKPGQAGE